MLHIANYNSSGNHTTVLDHENTFEIGALFAIFTGTLDKFQSKFFSVEITEKG